MLVLLLFIFPQSTVLGEELMSLWNLVSDVDAGNTHFVFDVAPYRIAQVKGSDSSLTRV